MRKIVDTYVIGTKPIRGGRCEKWWQSNSNNLKRKKNKKKSFCVKWCFKVQV